MILFTGLNREVSEGKVMSDHGHFSSYEDHRSGEWARFQGLFKDTQGFGRLDAGSRAGFASSRPPPPWTSVFQCSYFCTMCGLEKLGVVDQNWLERFFRFFAENAGRG